MRAIKISKIAKVIKVEKPKEDFMLYGFLTLGLGRKKLRDRMCGGKVMKVVLVGLTDEEVGGVGSQTVGAADGDHHQGVAEQGGQHQSANRQHLEPELDIAEVRGSWCPGSAFPQHICGVVHLEQGDGKRRDSAGLPGVIGFQWDYSPSQKGSRRPQCVNCECVSV